ncbi:NADH--cytochrome b5 reductase 1-like [Silene latifolia]|uniref:NADH--cytochrome b5 reductase 1-like n=1 Tax=Silene latifolia TaxID=37657 RepID=UPI003D780223
MMNNRVITAILYWQVRAFGMLAGGTGITQMFQVTGAILENSSDKTKVHLVYANVNYEDILLKVLHIPPSMVLQFNISRDLKRSALTFGSMLLEELDGFARDYCDRFSVYYVLKEPPEDWIGGCGIHLLVMIQAHCPEPASDIKILRCGPPAMNKAMATHLGTLGYSYDMQFQF